jgi:hypothetical protein
VVRPRGVCAGVIGLALASSVMACGSQSAGKSGDQPLPTSVTTSVRAAASELQRAFHAGDYENVCALLTPTAQAQAGKVDDGEPTTCIRDVKRSARSIASTGGWSLGRRPRVADVTGEGDKRWVTFETESGRRATAPFVRQAGRWRLASYWGATSSALRQVVRTGVRPPVAPVGERAVEVTRGGRRCPSVRLRKPATLSGGCIMRAWTTREPVRALTPFGELKVGECQMNFKSRVMGNGRTWVENVESARPWSEDYMEAAPPDVRRCSTLHSCHMPGNRGLTVSWPWRGRLTARADGEITYRVAACIQSSVGAFVGDLVMRLAGAGAQGHLDPADEDTTGFRVDRFNVLPDIALVLRPRGGGGPTTLGNTDVR